MRGIKECVNTLDDSLHSTICVSILLRHLAWLLVLLPGSSGSDSLRNSIGNQMIPPLFFPLKENIYSIFNL